MLIVQKKVLKYAIGGITFPNYTYETHVSAITLVKVDIYSLPSCTPEFEFHYFYAIYH